MSIRKRPLEGIKVIELATFIAVPAAGRILADWGAEVIKIESPKGDNLRFTAPTEGRPLDDYENTTFDLENANKRGIALNTKTEAGKKILFQLLETADVFLTNLRPEALKRAGLDYETLKTSFPKLVYGNATGYGEVGPDRDLPGFDFTAFFARGGFLGTLYQKGTVPMNVIPGLGDHQCALALAAGVLAALYQAKVTGLGEKVSTNLLHTAIYMQGIMIQAAQYPELGQVYPIDRRTTVSPFIIAYKTKDDRFIQLCMPVYDDYYNTFVKCIGRNDLVDDPRYCKLRVMAEAKTSCELYDIIWEAIAQKTVEEWIGILTKNDIPFSPAQTWEEILVDEQAWAINTFYRMKYDNGHELSLVRPPIDMVENGLPPYVRSPFFGEHGPEILAGLGYSDTQIKELLEKKDVIVKKRETKKAAGSN
jgi:cinnamoyl-CoA:phenyllactate CoA-transferase